MGRSSWRMAPAVTRRPATRHRAVARRAPRSAEARSASGVAGSGTAWPVLAKRAGVLETIRRRMKHCDDVREQVDLAAVHRLDVTKRRWCLVGDEAFVLVKQDDFQRLLAEGTAGRSSSILRRSYLRVQRSRNLGRSSLRLALACLNPQVVGDDEWKVLGSLLVQQFGLWLPVQPSDVEGPIGSSDEVAASREASSNEIPARIGPRIGPRHGLLTAFPEESIVSDSWIEVAPHASPEAVPGHVDHEVVAGSQKPGKRDRQELVRRGQPR